MSTVSRKSARTGRETADSDASSSAEEKQSVDYKQDPRLYFNTLNKTATHSRKVRFNETQQEKTLMEYLPVNERFNMNKEGKVIARWVERQREWERIQSAINSKMKSKHTTPLMMATTDDYRAKIEQYDLLQAGIPLKDRYSGASWQQSLRGGGPMVVPVGHIFSGIEAAIDREKFPNPLIVRKPRNPSLVEKSGQFMDLTKSFVAQKERLAKSLKKLRPHEVTFKEAANLVVRSEDLFQWARRSAEEYFHEQEDRSRLVAIAESEDGSSLANDDDASAEQRLAANDNVAGRGQGVKVEFYAETELVFQCNPGQKCVRSVSFRNIGATAISFKWTRDPSAGHHDDDSASGAGAGGGGGSGGGGASLSAESAKGSAASGVGGGAGGKKKATPAGKIATSILAKKGIQNGELRAHMLNRKRNSFFCVKPEGVVLPNEVVSTTFCFSSRAGAGAFRSEWILQFTPTAKVFLIPPVRSLSGIALSKGGGSVTNTAVGFVVMALRGHCLPIDDSVAKRREIKSYVEERVTDTMARDIIDMCINRVRQPVRVGDIQRRQIDLFRSVNKQKLDSISAQFTSLMPLFIDPKRLATFADSYASADKLFCRVQRRLIELQEEELVTRGDGSDMDAAMAAASALATFADSNPFAMADKTVERLLSVVFPEEIIEVFDEITLETVIPTWDFSMDTILAGLEKTRCMATEVQTLEEALLKRKITSEKEAARQARHAARRAAGDDSDDDEEDEEEEEEEEEEDGKIKPKHAFLVEIDELRAATIGALLLLVSGILPTDRLAEIIAELFGVCVDGFDSVREKALVAAEMTEIAEHSVPIPLLPSPFLSEEGAAAWKKALATTSIEEEEDPAAAAGGKVKGKKPSKAKPKPKAKKGEAAIPDPPTPEQVNFFYRNLYDGMRGLLLDMAEKIVSVVDPEMHMMQSLSSPHQPSFAAASAAAVPALADAPGETESTTNLLVDVGVIRADDFQPNPEEREMNSGGSGGGTIAFLNFDGDAFTLEDDKEALSAFDASKQRKLRAVQPVLQLLQVEAKALVLLYESNNPTTSASAAGSDGKISRSLIEKVAEIHELVTEKRAAYMEENDKLRKRAKLPKVEYKSVEFVPCRTVAELKIKMELLLEHGASALLDLRQHPPAADHYTAPEAVEEGEDREGKRETLAGKYFASAIPIVILENLSLEGVVPEEPLLVIEDSDDDEAPIPVGAEEQQREKIEKWNAKRPHVVSVQVPALITATAPTTVADGGDRGPENKSSGLSLPASSPTVAVDCYADAAASVMEVYSLVMARNDYRVQWVEGNASSLFRPESRSAFQNLQKIVSDRIVSQEVREAFLWAGSLQLLPQVRSLLKQVADYNTYLSSSSSSSSDGIAGEGAGEEEGAVRKPSGIAQRLAQLFPYSLQTTRTSEQEDALAEQQMSMTQAAIDAGMTPSTSSTPQQGSAGHKPHAVAVVGGALTMDKFRVLDGLVDSFDTILLVGEMSLAFLACSDRLSFPKYTSSTDNSNNNRRDLTSYRAVCRQILRKARMRGVAIVLPEDIVTGDEDVGEEERRGCYENVDPDSRSEGVEYEGESAVVYVGVVTPEREGDNDFVPGAAYILPSPPATADGGGKTAGGALPNHDAPATAAAVVGGVLEKPKQVVNGYAFDMGPKTCQRMTELVSAADLVFVWGTVGACEVSSFQIGQQALVTATANKPVEENPVSGSNASATATTTAAAAAAVAAKPVLTANPRTVLLLGDSCVEWFTRFVDSDGELTGDLVAAGCVTFAARQSALLSALLGRYPTKLLGFPAPAASFGTVGGGVGGISSVQQEVENGVKVGEREIGGVSDYVERAFKYRPGIFPEEFVYNTLRKFDDEDDDEEDEEEEED